MVSLHCNNFEVTSQKEAFCFTFKFDPPDGSAAQKVFVSISPSGAKTFQDILAGGMKDYEAKHGAVTPWPADKKQDTAPGNNKAYTS